MKSRKNIILKSSILLLILFFQIGPHAATAKTSSSVSVVVSQKIKPYIEALNGIENILRSTGVPYDVIFLDKSEKQKVYIPDDSTISNLYSISIAVGPEAALFLWEQDFPKPFPILYTMILHPEKISGAPKKMCGIPLSIPEKIQITDIANILPSLKRIGLLYDPVYNQNFFEESAKYALSLGIDLVPLKVSSKKEIPAILKEHWIDIDGLWLIPDRTVISESVVQFIIKEMLLKNIPVIGYNRFFYESGATFNFIFDYEELGKQTAKYAIDILSGGDCRQKDPNYQIWLNKRALSKIGIPFWVDNTDILRVLP